MGVVATILAALQGSGQGTRQGKVEAGLGFMALDSNSVYSTTPGNIYIHECFMLRQVKKTQKTKTFTLIFFLFVSFYHYTHGYDLLQ